MIGSDESKTSADPDERSEGKPEIPALVLPKLQSIIFTEVRHYLHYLGIVFVHKITVKMDIYLN